MFWFGNELKYLIINQQTIHPKDIDMTEVNEFNQMVGDIIENWSPRAYPSKNKMIGKYCVLERLDIAKHAAALFDALCVNNNSESWTYLPYGPFHHKDEFNTWIKKTIEISGDILYAILDIKTNTPIGISGFLRIFPDHGSIEVGHLHFSKALKQTPLATEAIYLMMSFIFDELSYRRLEWKCHSMNEPSKNAARRFGFQFEGIFRQSFVFKNRNRDTAWFSIIDSEWPELKNKFEKWLSDCNFDSSGKQIKKLQDC